MYLPRVQSYFTKTKQTKHEFHEINLQIFGVNCAQKRYKKQTI